MKNHNNTDDKVNKIDEIRESTKKHDVNLKSNSSLYFQIGLILCLLATYGLFEMNFEMKMPKFTNEYIIENTDPYVGEVVIEVPVTEEPKPIEKKVAMLTNKPPVIKPNDFVIADPVVIVTPDDYVPDPKPTVKKAPPTDTPAPTLPTTFNMKDVEKVPIFPGCESATNNAERMACMSEKLTKLIQKKFNTDLASELGLYGVQKIQVQFRIDDKGRVTDIKTRSPYSQLEKEAERVVSKIPVMTPGMQRNTPVSVVYYLPIAFQVQ